MAVVVAHPGHELVIHHWMEREPSLYFCLTDGSGGDGLSRMESTGLLLSSLGATPGSLYGRYTDRQVYRFLLEQRLDIFLALRDELAESMIDAGVTRVAGDAVEGFNPVHDLCRGLIDGAVDLIRTRTGRVVRNDEFNVVEPAPHVHWRAATSGVQLDSAALSRKIAAAKAYPEMQEEVHRALDQFGVQAFAIESLQPSSLATMMEKYEGTPPAYEAFGKIRVDEGRYDEIIRYRAHLLPIFGALGIVRLVSQSAS